MRWAPFLLTKKVWLLIVKARSHNEELSVCLGINWLTDVPSGFPVPDKFSLLSYQNHKWCPAFNTHTHTPTLLHFLSSFPVDVPQWHWCCTSFCLTSEVSILRQQASYPAWGIFSPRAREQTYLPTKDDSMPLLPSEDSLVLLTPICLKWKMCSVSFSGWKEKKSCKTCSIIDTNCSSCWWLFFWAACQ